MKLFNSDCMEVMKSLPSRSVDLIVTDPPYKMDIGAGKGCFSRHKQMQYNDLKDISNGISNEYLEAMDAGRVGR